MTTKKGLLDEDICTLCSCNVRCGGVSPCRRSERRGEAALIPGAFSANAAVTTNYLFRGISQTDNDPAIQGGFDYAHDIGVYLGVWGSNVDFNDGDEAHLELDFYGGVSSEIGGVSWDIGAIYFSYPGAAYSLDYDFIDAALSLGYDFKVVSLSAGLNYSPDNFGGSGDAFYYHAGASIPLPAEFSLDANVGRQEIDDNTAFGTPDYTDWNVGISRDFLGFNLSLTYHDTDLSTVECGNDNCDARAVFTVSREF